ncbi:SpoIIE family protein phosphatase [candidate division KSB1 bacterium]|nr:SpoIIE family protein phosphatase [candidate division KSB1 bacterium]
MMQNRVKKTPIFIALLLFLVTIVGSRFVPTVLSISGNLMIALAIWLSFFLIPIQKWLAFQSNIQTIRQIFFIILFTDLASHFVEPSSGESSVLVWLWAVYSTTAVLILLSLFRHLIYIKRKPSTERNFGWMIFFMLLIAFLRTSAGQPVANLPLPFTENGVMAGLGWLILLVLFGINGSRVSWIHYLNRRQKLASFWGGLFLLPFAWHLVARLFDFSAVTIAIPFLGAFLALSVLFFALYLTIALLVVTAHLPTAHLFDRKIREMESLYALSSTMSSEFDLQKLVSQIVKLAAKVTEAEYSWLELVDQGSQSLDLVAWCNLTDKEKRLRQKYLPRIEQMEDLTQKKALVENQMPRNSRLRFFARWKANLGSLLIVPMVSGQESIGYLYAGKSGTFGFEQEDVELLNAFAAQAVIAVENTRLIKASLLKERFEHELRLAHDAQMNLLPKCLPDLPGLQVEAICKTANEVGGDYYDFIDLEHGGKWGVVVGDVSGKGASAAFYMAEIKGVIDALARTLCNPLRVVREANRIIYKSIESNHFITLIYGMIDLQEKCFTFCRAGHCPVLLADKDQDEIVALQPNGLGIGLDSGPVFDAALNEEKIELHPGMTLLLYTDGATEIRNTLGEEYGEQRLIETLASLKGLPAKQVRQGLLNAIDQFVGDAKAHDDLTLVVITFDWPEHFTPIETPRSREVEFPDSNSDISIETEVDR